LMWRKAITASTTFCQLRSSIFDRHLVNHVLSSTLPACWELRYLCSNFSIRIAGDQRALSRWRAESAKNPFPAYPQATATAARQVCIAAPITSYSAALVCRRPAATSAALMFCQTSPHRDQTARRIVLRPAEFRQWQKTSNARFFRSCGDIGAAFSATPQCGIEAFDEGMTVDRLAKEGDGAGRLCALANSLFGESGNENDRHVRTAYGQLALQFQPTHSLHLHVRDQARGVMQSRRG
jgi:hypothetical protein